MRRSGSTSTLRSASVFRVGSLSGVPFLPPNREHDASDAATASSSAVRAGAKRSGLRRCTLGLLGVGGVGAVVELGDREPRLRRVVGQPFLLTGELGDGDVLHRFLLLAAERGDARD